MKWERKQKLIQEEKRHKKKVIIPRVVAVNIDDPKKVFMSLPILFQWDEIDCVPVLIIISPHEKFDEICDCYYEGIRSSFDWASHCDTYPQSRRGQHRFDDPNLEFLLLNTRRFHAIWIDPGRHSMSELMRREPEMHKAAMKEWFRRKELFSARRNLYSWTTYAGTTANTTATVTFGGQYIGTTASWFIS